MKLSFIWLLLSAGMSGNLSAANNARSVTVEVALHEGRIRGAKTEVDGVLAFKGITYARAPVGVLRWRAPQPVPNWGGVRDASAVGPRCPAPSLGGPARLAGPTSEDCLSLNVWTPAKTAGDKLPVMVWIHGGGFQFGSGAEPNTDGARLAGKGAVVVTINYRLGILGFLAHPQLDSEGASGNYGLQDQIAALHWVKRNIGRFGGDPRNITLFGESAGANSVGLLMTSPLAHGLFQRAIAESGAFWDGDRGSIQTHAEALAAGSATVEALADGSLAAMRRLPVDALIARTGWNIQRDPVSEAFSPNIDGYVLREPPAAAFAHGRQARIPLLAGWNGAEGFIFRNRAFPTNSVTAFETAAAARFGKSNLSAFLRNYPAPDRAAAAQSAEAAIGDMIVREQVWEALQLHSRLMPRATFGYVFDHRSAYAPIPAHAAEIDFVFGTLRPQMLGKTPMAGETDKIISDAMMRYWVGFAAHGRPVAEGLPLWPAYTASAPRLMNLGPLPVVEVESRTAGLDFLRSLRNSGRFPQRWRANAEGSNSGNDASPVPDRSPNP